VTTRKNSFIKNILVCGNLLLLKLLIEKKKGFGSPTITKLRSKLRSAPSKNILFKYKSPFCRQFLIKEGCEIINAT